MRGILRAAGYAALFGVFVLVATGASFYVMAVSRVPKVDGEITDPALSAPVTVMRDEWGVPHITAENETDAYFALGLAMAQDRLFQMEALRRVARGQIAEAFGPAFVPVDKVLRCFQLGRQADALFEGPSVFPPEMIAAMDAFVAGVNHIVAEPNHLPFEFAMVRIDPRPFTKADCVAVAAVLPITFAEGLRLDALATLLQAQQPDLDTGAFFPGYGNEIPVTIMESIEEAEALLEARRAAGAMSAAEREGAAAAIPFLKSWLAALDPIRAVAASAAGSNSWVLSGSRTASGKPILANDPHIAFTNPGIWYEAHVQYGAVENYGWFLPPVPFPLLAHNAQRAWALTMFENDDVDLYLETFDPNDPNKVMYRGNWTDAERIEETIPVRWGADERYTLRVTPHGPVISDMLEAFDLRTEKPVAMTWLWQHVPRTDLAAFYEMSRATDLTSFENAVAKIVSPGLNVSYADAAGNIAWWAAGLLPIRPDHVNPKSLLDGASGRDEILGYLPFTDNPKLVNPPAGVIVTANNMPTAGPVGSLPRIDGYWQPSDRAARLEALLAERSDWTVEALKAVQNDVANPAAAAVAQTLLNGLPGDDALAPGERNVKAALADWDGVHNGDSRGAAAYEVLCASVIRRAWLDELGEEGLAVYGGLADCWNHFKAFAGDPASPFWDDRRTAPIELRGEILLAALGDAAVELERRLGPDPAAWRWDKLHALAFVHPLGMTGPLGPLFNIGPYPVSGGNETVNNMQYAWGQFDFAVQSGPSTRRLIDFADPEGALSILPTGNSGHFMSPHYADQAALFAAGTYRPARMASAEAVHTLTLKPGPTAPQ